MGLIYLGEINSPKGIGGDIRLYSYDNLLPLKGKVIIKRGRRKDLLNIERVKKEGEFRYVVKFVEASNIGEVEKYKSSKLYIATRDVENYFNDPTMGERIGMKVVDMKYGELGVVENISFNTKYFLYAVKGKVNYIIPDIEEFVISVDRKRGEIKVKMGEVDRFEG